MMAQHNKLNAEFKALCFFRTSIAKTPYNFCHFTGGGGGSGHPVPPSGREYVASQNIATKNVLPVRKESPR